MTSGPPPNYYAVLEVSETATASQIRDAYKRAALKSHPDRVPADSPDRAPRTRQFQLVNDAYYTLSDATRRRDYDAQRKLWGGGGRRQNPSSSSSSNNMPGGFGFSDDSDSAQQQQPGSSSWRSFFGGGAGGTNANNAQQQQQQQQAEDAQFADVFEEMLREEGLADPDGSGRPTGRFWSMVGGLSGGALGFILANVPGLLAGAVAGNRLGAVRDAKGKSVYAVFQELPQADRARLLSQLAAKVFSHAVGV